MSPPDAADQRDAPEQGRRSVLALELLDDERLLDLVGAIDAKEIDRYRQHKVREAAVCRAAIDAGRPLMVEIVDKRGRRYQRVQKPCHRDRNAPPRPGGKLNPLG